MIAKKKAAQPKKADKVETEQLTLEQHITQVENILLQAVALLNQMKQATWVMHENH